VEESVARSLTVISLLLQSTTHCRYRVYTKSLLTYTAIYRRNRKVLPLGITALQPQSHFHLGTPYKTVFRFAAKLNMKVTTGPLWFLTHLSLLASFWKILLFVFQLFKKFLCFRLSTLVVRCCVCSNSALKITVRYSINSVS
jgi:hypothetical protein